MLKRRDSRLHHEIRFVLACWDYVEPVGYIIVTSCGDVRVCGLAPDNKRHLVPELRRFWRMFH